MNIFKKRPQPASSNDSALVMASLGGDKDAFCEIVSRYQNLLCSLAYSSLGDLKYSEDVTQEAFVEAWKKLDSLRDPEKLKSWLCGILRYKVSHFRRKEAHQPIKDASELDQLDEQSETQSSQRKVEDQAISAQQQALLWQALEKMPETYREPLILFYREHRSVEYVASQLDLTEDTVKQRLSRGRKQLQKAMITFVEDTLTKSKQGTAFTVAVMAAIHGISPPVKASIIGTGAVKGGLLFKWASLLVLLASFAGVISSYFGLRAALDQSRTERERKRTIIAVSQFFGMVIVYVIAIVGLKPLALHYGFPAWFSIGASQFVVIGFIISYLLLCKKMLRDTRRVRAQERIFHPEAFTGEADQVNAKQREFKSRLRLAGVPLLHFRFGMPEEGDKPIVGWIAGGDLAYGYLFAWGGVAVAPISVGIIAVGLISIGAVGFGLFGIGTVAVGAIAFGSSAIGYKAYSSFSSLGWESAFSNGFSIAKDAAIGPIAFAQEINSPMAASLTNLALLEQSYLWVLAAIAIFVIVPAVLYSNKVRERMRTP